MLTAEQQTALQQLDPQLVEALTLKIASYVFEELDAVSKDPNGPLHRDLYVHLLRKMC